MKNILKINIKIFADTKIIATFAVQTTSSSKHLKI